MFASRDVFIYFRQKTWIHMRCWFHVYNMFTRHVKVECFESAVPAIVLSYAPAFFWPMLGTHGHWALKVFKPATPTVTLGIRLLSPRTRDTHTYCRTFSSGAVTTCFYDWGLSRLGFEHPTFFLRCEHFYPLHHCSGPIGQKKLINQSINSPVQTGLLLEKSHLVNRNVSQKYLNNRSSCLSTTKTDYHLLGASNIIFFAFISQKNTVPVRLYLFCYKSDINLHVQMKLHVLAHALCTLDILLFYMCTYKYTIRCLDSSVSFRNAF